MFAIFAALTVFPFVASEYVLVTVENTSPDPGGTGLSMMFVGFHDGDFDMFEMGEAASSALEMMAEDGESEGFQEQFVEDGQKLSQSEIVGVQCIRVGMSASRVVEVNETSSKSHYFSYIGMVGPSNDAFVGNDDPKAHAIFTNENFESLQIVVMGSETLDAGTEVNDELAESVPPLGGEFGVGEDENGVVHIHPGFNPRGSGGILDQEMSNNGDFKEDGYQQAIITVEVIHECCQPKGDWDCSMIPNQVSCDSRYVCDWICDNEPLDAGQHEGCEYEEGAYTGHRIATHNDVESAEDCCGLCGTEPECSVWNFNQHLQLCLLFSMQQGSTILDKDEWVHGMYSAANDIDPPGLVAAPLNRENT